MVISLKFLDTHVQVEYFFVLAAYLIKKLQGFVPKDDEFLLQTVYLVEISLFTACVAERLFPYLLHLFSYLLYMPLVCCQKFCLVALDNVLDTHINIINILDQLLMRIFYDFFIALAR